MMPYDEFSARIESAYKLFLMALTGVYRGNVITGAQRLSPHSLGQAKRSAALAELRFLEIVSRDTATHFNGGGEELMIGLKKAASENVAQILRSIRVGLPNLGKTMTSAHGGIGLLLQKKMGQVEFKLYDTADRRWDAEKLVALTVRDFAYQAWLDDSVEGLKRQGYKLARPSRIVPRDTDEAFSIRGEVEGYPTFEEVRAKYYHINSTARIEGYVQT